jgi:thymidylate kinase
MATGRLILIEGMIGAGKSTTAAKLATWLDSQGEDVRVYQEFADGHPIRTRAVDLLRAAHAGAAALPDVGADGLALDPAVYGLEQWTRLAGYCSRDGHTVILEGAFLQNSVLPHFLDGEPVDTVKEVCASIESRIAPARPLLVYLRPSDIDQAVRRVHDERGAASAAQNIAFVSNCPWARRRGLTGRQTIVELYRAWEDVVTELLRTTVCTTLLLVDPQDDWETALERIYSAVRT